MRRLTRGAGRFAIGVFAAAIAIACCACPSWARTGESPFTGYGRRGAELWVEAPRFTAPIGDAYMGEYRIENGWGFGFGLMFGLTDVIALEGRVLQSDHKVTSTGDRWDLDHAFVGLRYTFSPEEAWQPFVSVGGVRLSLERASVLETSADFRRRTGYGAFVAAGLDYVLSPRFVLSVRGDYVVMWYSREYIGTDEFEIDGAPRGDGAGATLCLGYRVPTW
jgi:hypothetical protein